MKLKVFSTEAGFLREGVYAEQDQQISLHVDGIYREDVSPYRVFLQVEPPEQKDLVRDLIQYHLFYDLILAWNEDILHRCPNAVKFVGSSAPWYKGFNIMPKSFSVSMLISNKYWCPGHRLRLAVFDRLLRQPGILPVIGHQSPPPIEPGERDFLFSSSQYHVAIENSQHNNYFTEKLMDCFLARTIPIYWGCPNIDEYFNMDGIFTFQNYEELTKILKSLTPDDYQKRAGAVEDNFQRALQYVGTSKITGASRVDEAIREHVYGYPQHDSKERSIKY